MLGVEISFWSVFWCCTCLTICPPAERVREPAWRSEFGGYYFWIFENIVIFLTWIVRAARLLPPLRVSPHLAKPNDPLGGRLRMTPPNVDPNRLTNPNLMFFTARSRAPWRGFFISNEKFTAGNHIDIRIILSVCYFPLRFARRFSIFWLISKIGW